MPLPPAKCTWLPQGLRPFEKIIPTDVFNMCLWDWGKTADNKNLLFSNEKNPLARKLIGVKDEVIVKRIENSGTQGI